MRILQLLGSRLAATHQQVSLLASEREKTLLRDSFMGFVEEKSYISSYTDAMHQFAELSLGMTARPLRRQVVIPNLIPDKARARAAAARSFR